MLSIAKSKKKSKKKRDKKLQEKAEQDQSVNIEDSQKMQVDPAQNQSKSLGNQFYKIFDEVEAESQSLVDPYKKLNIKSSGSNVNVGSTAIKSIMGPEIALLYDRQCKESMFLIENYIPGQTNSVPRLSRKKSRVLKSSKSNFKKAKIFDITQEQIRFEEMLPMHKMWNE